MTAVMTLNIKWAMAVLFADTEEPMEANKAVAVVPTF